MTSIALNEMVTRGACTKDIDTLRPLYIDEILILHPDEIVTLTNSGVNALWGVKMLDVPHQIALAELWYDRAMDASVVAWKSEVRNLLSTLDITSAKSHSSLRGLESREAVTETERCEAGVGHAMAALGLLFAEGHGVGSSQVCKGMYHLAKWCANCIVDAEAITFEAAKESLTIDMLTSLDINGVVEIP